jgi:hypothetical protein
MVGRLGCGLERCRPAALDVTRTLVSRLQDPHGGWTTLPIDQHQRCRIPILGEVHHCLPCTCGARTTPDGATARRLLMALCPDGGAKTEDSISAQSFLLDSRFSTSPARFEPPPCTPGSKRTPNRNVKVQFYSRTSPKHQVSACRFFQLASETIDYIHRIVHHIAYMPGACSL